MGTVPAKRQKHGDRAPSFYDLLAAARRYPLQGVGLKFTFQVLIEHMGLVDGTWCCWPGESTVAAETGQSARSVRRQLDELEQQGLVTKRRQAIPDQPRGGVWTTYVLNLELLMAGGPTGQVVRLMEDDQPDTGDRPTGQNEPTNRTTAATAPSIGTEEQFELTPRAVDALLGFPEFWETYPKRDGKRVGRGRCEALWAKLTLEDRRAAWRGARNYAASGWRPKDPERWLRDRLWTEWQEPARPDSNGRPRPLVDRIDQDRDAPSGFLVAP